ncbi:hypothetical protein BGW80DRAFT_1176218 [Lactifluus volemus]|nr:hypothetical protein BGW80DRAFT_1176218 [Lactifluus volemus]
MSPSSSLASSFESESQLIKQHSPPVAVYCGACFGNDPAFQHAAASVGRALVMEGRSLVYGGGSNGMMGTVSGAVLKHGGTVTAVTPTAILMAGGEGERISVGGIELGEKGHERIVVDSMHQRKVEMARRVCGFIGLPGGFGTFEEIMEVTTWTQLGIHCKRKFTNFGSYIATLTECFKHFTTLTLPAVVLVNVHGFFDPLRALIKNSIASGFIQARNEDLIVFVDAPAGADPRTFDWGRAALDAMSRWCSPGPGLFNWEVSTCIGNRTAEYPCPARPYNST